MCNTFVDKNLPNSMTKGKQSQRILEGEALVGRLQACVMFVELAARGEHYFRTLETLQREIADVRRQVGQLERLSTDDWYDIYAEEEGEYVEMALGCSYAVGQAYITSVVSRMVKVGNWMERCQVKVNGMPKSKGACLNIGKRVNRRVSKAKLINALANYYKHHEEWQIDWTNLDEPAQGTVATLTAVGIERGSGVLRTGADLLGIDLSATDGGLNDILEEWSGAILRGLYGALASSTTNHSNRP